MRNTLNIITSLHKSTPRNYFERMANDKVACAEVARRFDKDFWDGERKYGFGGYKYDGRWASVAQKLIGQYNLKDGASILDVGCGKGFILYEFKKLLPNAKVKGFDISQYAVENGKEELRADLFVHKAQDPYPFKDKEFDLVISLNTIHNLYIHELKAACREMERVGVNKYTVVESYRNVQELFNVQCWALTCEMFFTPDEWIWLFKEFGYSGDYEFIFFE